MQTVAKVESRSLNSGPTYQLLPETPVTNCILLTVAVFFQLIYFYFSYELQSGIIGEFQPVHCISFLAGKKGIHHSLFLQFSNIFSYCYFCFLNGHGFSFPMQLQCKHRPYLFNQATGKITYGMFFPEG